MSNDAKNTEDIEAENDALIVRSMSEDATPDWRGKATHFVKSIIPTMGALLSVISGVPSMAPLGSAAGGLAALYVTHGQKKKLRRLQTLTENIEMYSQQLAEDKLDEDYLGSEEHLDLLHEIFSAAAQSRDGDTERCRQTPTDSTPESTP